MNYLQIVDLVFGIIALFLSLFTLHFVVFFIVGIFAKKKFPKTDKRLKYGIVISARNEEKVISNLIDSIKKCNYPQDKLQVFVVAHNCTDNTAQIAKDAGAVVYEYNNDKERTKGYALRFLFNQIKNDYGIENYDGFFIFDADNILSENYIEKMNDAFVAKGSDCVITSFRNSKNFGANLISAAYGLFFIQGCRYESRGRTVLNCSTRVSGTGYLLSADIVKDGWPYVTLTEDWEFTADRVLNGTRIFYCDEAVFYDEQPVSVKIMLRQRLRWAKGHLLVCLTRLKNLIAGMFRPVKRGGTKHKFSIFDITANILPIAVIAAFAFVLKIILLAIAPVFGYNAAEVWIKWAIGIGRGALISYGLMFIAGILLTLLEHKRIKNINFFVLAGALLFWPLFLFLAVPLSLIAIFIRKLEWKTIPHKYNTTIKNENKKRRQKIKKQKRITKQPSE